MGKSPSAPTDPSDTLQVAYRLRLTREALGLTQAALCRRAGISPQAWNNSETGDSRLSVNNAIRLYRATGADLNWLYCGVRACLPAVLIDAIARVEAERENQPT